MPKEDFGGMQPWPHSQSSLVPTRQRCFLDTAHALAIPAVKNLLSSQTFPILMMEMGSLTGLTGSQTCQGSDCDDAFALAGGPLDVGL